MSDEKNLNAEKDAGQPQGFNAAKAKATMAITDRSLLKDGKNNPIPMNPYPQDLGVNFPQKKDPKKYRYVGKPIPRKDSRAIVTGQATFLDDFKLPGMIYGKDLKSPYPHANIISIDVEEAKKVPGVHAILTYKDVDPRLKFGMPPHKPIMDRRLRYVGDTVALVAADTIEICNAALDLIKVEYEQLEPVYDAISAVKDGAPRLYESSEYENNIVPGGYPRMQWDGDFYHLVRGDAEKGFDECVYIAEDTVEFEAMCAPAAPEPPGALARWDGGNNYTLWGTTQSTHLMKAFNSAILMGTSSDGTPPYLNVKTFNVGGSYGNKQALGLMASSAVLLSRATCRPVKFFETKVEQKINGQTRLGSQLHAKIGMDAEGVVRCVKGDWFVDAGAYCDGLQGQVGVGLGEAQLCMSQCMNWDLNTKIAVTNKQAAGVVRGYGGQELNSCLALLMARTMEAGNFDPVEVFKKNYVKDGDRYVWRDGRPWMAHSINYVPIMDAMAEKFDWKDKWKGWGIPTWTSECGRYVRGVGVGIIGNADVGEDNSECYVRVHPDTWGPGIKVVVHANITESGMGQRSNVLKVVAETLNMPMEWIFITEPDDRINPFGFGLAGSRGTITWGHALTNAAEDVKRQILKAAELRMEANADSLDIEGSYVVCPLKPEKRILIRELTDKWMTFTGYGKHLEQFSTPNFFMVMLEVEVDKETGKAEVLNILGGTDCGQIIDPPTLEMQAHSGIGCACLDTALFEEHIVDPATGRPLTFNQLEYKWRPFNQFPKFDTLFMESQWDSFQYHAIGVGEIAGAAAASACLVAISNAIGARVATYPATPSVILKALGKL